MLHMMDNGLGHEEFGVFRGGSVEGTIGSNESTVPSIAGVMIGESTSTAEDIVFVRFQHGFGLFRGGRRRFRVVAGRGQLEIKGNVVTHIGVAYCVFCS